VNVCAVSLQINVRLSVRVVEVPVAISVTRRLNQIRTTLGLKTLARAQRAALVAPAMTKVTGVAAVVAVARRLTKCSECTCVTRPLIVCRQMPRTFNVGVHATTVTVVTRVRPLVVSIDYKHSQGTTSAMPMVNVCSCQRETRLSVASLLPVMASRVATPAISMAESKVCPTAVRAVRQILISQRVTETSCLGLLPWVSVIPEAHAYLPQSRLTWCVMKIDVSRAVYSILPMVATPASVLTVGYALRLPAMRLCVSQIQAVRIGFAATAANLRLPPVQCQRHQAMATLMSSHHP
jgi:hypothetical protein